MAILSDYTNGTIAIANGSTTVTGVNTAWNLTELQEGDLLLVNNRSAVIQSVNSATSITLTRPWTDTAVPAGTPYRARYMADASRYTAIAKALLTMLASGNVEAFAGLQGAANRVPRFTGAQTMDLVPIQSATDDTTANAILKLGAFGLGALSLQGEMPYPNLTLNDLTNVRTGFYYISVGAGNGGPMDPGGSFGSMIVLRRTSQIVHQIFTLSSVSNPQTFVRATTDNGTTWGAWTELLTSQYAGARGRELLAANTADDLIAAAKSLYGGSAPTPTDSGISGLANDFDTLVKPGVFTLAGTFTNGPNGPAASSYTGLVAVHRRVFNNSSYQMCFVNNVISIRMQNTGGSWTAWEQIATYQGNNRWFGSQTLDTGTGGYVNYEMKRGTSSANFEMLSTGEARLKTISNTNLFLAVNSTIDQMKIDGSAVYFITTDALIDPTSATTDGKYGMWINTNGRMTRQSNGYNPFRQRRQGSDGAVQEFYQAVASTTAAGNISVAGATTTYGTSSDYRLKSDVEPLVDFTLDGEDFAELGSALLRVMALRPVRFRWIGLEDRGFQHGLIAHEAQPIVPHAVTGEKDETKWFGHEIIPAYETEVEKQVEKTDDEGNSFLETVTETIVVPEQRNDDVREDGVTPGAEFFPTEQRPVHQSVDYGQVATDAVAALQESTLMILELRREIATLKARLDTAGIA